MMLLTDRVWVSPGQWGNAAFFAFLMACLGGLIVNRAARSDVTYAFIVAYLVLVFGRSAWLGEPLAIPIHRLENGALLLFTFFMISDPRTTPDSRAGRIVFACLVATGAWYVQFGLFRTNGVFWSLAAWSMTVPLIDWLLPGVRYAWSGERVNPSSLIPHPESRIPDPSSRIRNPAIPDLMGEGRATASRKDAYEAGHSDGGGAGDVRVGLPRALRLLRFLRSEG